MIKISFIWAVSLQWEWLGLKMCQSYKVVNSKKRLLITEERRMYAGDYCPYKSLVNVSWKCTMVPTQNKVLMYFHNKVNIFFKAVYKILLNLKKHPSNQNRNNLSFFKSPSGFRKDGVKVKNRWTGSTHSAVKLLEFEFCLH